MHSTKVVRIEEIGFAGGEVRSREVDLSLLSIGEGLTDINVSLVEVVLIWTAVCHGDECGLYGGPRVFVVVNRVLNILLASV